MNNSKKASRSQKKSAKELLRLGIKAHAYRKDLLENEKSRSLEKAVEELQDLLKSKQVLLSELEEKVDNLDAELKISGGYYYHKKGWVENTEMLMVAAIVVIGIRSFFLQPFIIPTNSMYPSFYGMQPHLYEQGEEMPTILERSVEKILFGASHYKLEVENSGLLYLVLQNGGSFRYGKANFPNGRFFIFPSTVKEYVFEISGKEQIIQVPAEFDLDSLIAKKFAGIDDLRDLPLIVPQDQGFTGNRLKLSDASV